MKRFSRHPGAFHAEQIIREFPRGPQRHVDGVDLFRTLHSGAYLADFCGIDVFGQRLREVGASVPVRVRGNGGDRSGTRLPQEARPGVLYRIVCLWNPMFAASSSHRIAGNFH